MAASVLSLGMLTARAFWNTRRSVGFAAGSGPPACTAIAMSLATRVNCFAIRFQRANIACFLTSNMRPMAHMVAIPGQTARLAAPYSFGDSYECSSCGRTPKCDDRPRSCAVRARAPRPDRRGLRVSLADSGRDDSGAPVRGGYAGPGPDRHRQDRRLCLARVDRKSTRLNSSHQIISYAVFCLKK